MNSGLGSKKTSSCKWNIKHDAFNRRHWAAVVKYLVSPIPRNRETEIEMDVYL